MRNLKQSKLTFAGQSMSQGTSSVKLPVLGRGSPLKAPMLSTRARGSSCPVLLLVDHGPVRTGRLLSSSGLITYGGNFPGWWDPLVKGRPPGGGVQGCPRALHRARFQFSQHLGCVTGAVRRRFGQAAQQQSFQITTDRLATPRRRGLGGGPGVLHADLHHRSPVEHGRPGQQEIADGGEGINVRSGINLIGLVHRFRR